jgi:hypothetical protein
MLNERRTIKDCGLTGQARILPGFSMGPNQTILSIDRGTRKRVSAIRQHGGNRASLAGNENLEIQWRLATLKEAKAVVTQYHKFLSENSLIKTVVETDVSVAPGDFTPLEKQ